MLSVVSPKANSEQVCDSESLGDPRAEPADLRFSKEGRKAGLSCLLSLPFRSFSPLLQHSLALGLPPGTTNPT